MSEQIVPALGNVDLVNVGLGNVLGKLASLIDAGPQSRGAIRPSFAKSFAR
jgi:hypothetical protein